MQAYEEMPIEDFGKAYLRGLGWEEGGAVGNGSTKSAVVEGGTCRGRSCLVWALRKPDAKDNSKKSLSSRARAGAEEGYDLCR